ncbi:MAG: hypothetical protein PHQ75_01925 [Thermoguttaceae bacterium]|nr:hypothetical protein [Thermoguttaceae bacterium]
MSEGNLRLFPQGHVEGSTFCDVATQDGKFAFPSEGGLASGTYLVRITAVDREKSVFREQNGPVVSSNFKIVELIPPEWNTKSEKTTEIKNGKNVFEFDITP